MHDLDRVQLEMDDDDEFEADDFDEFETDFDDELDWSEEGPFDEDEEMELAMELLSVTSDEELEQFLGKIFKKVARTVKKAVRSPIFRKIVKFVKPLAKKALPIVGGIAGSALGGPVGGMIGGKLGSVASGLFEIDVTGLSGDELEMEISKRLVRLTAAAAKKALLAPKSMPASKIATAAIKAASKEHAPGLLKKGMVKGIAPSIPIGPARSGRWIRRGRKIIVLGA